MCRPRALCTQSMSALEKDSVIERFPAARAASGNFLPQALSGYDSDVESHTAKIRAQANLCHTPHVLVRGKGRLSAPSCRRQTPPGTRARIKITSDDQ